MTSKNRHVGELEQSLLNALDDLPDGVPKQYQAAVMLARMYAFNIDEAVATDTALATKALYLGPHFVNVLKVLDLYPAEVETSKTASGPGATARASVMELMEAYEERRNGTQS